MQIHGQHIARPDLVVGAGGAFGIDADGAALDELLRQGAGLERAREEQEPVEPFLADRLPGPRQALLARLAGRRLERHQLGTGAVGIKSLVFARLGRALEAGALALLVVGAAIVIAALAVEAGFGIEVARLGEVLHLALGAARRRGTLTALGALGLAFTLGPAAVLMAAIVGAPAGRRPDFVEFGLGRDGRGSLGSFGGSLDHGGGRNFGVHDRRSIGRNGVNRSFIHG